VANNAVLMAVGRAAQVIGVPLLLGLLGWLLTLVLALKDDVSRLNGQVAVLETRLTARIVSTEDRLGAQSRRMDITDARIERLADLTGKFSVDTAVLAEQIRALIAASKPAGSR